MHIDLHVVPWPLGSMALHIDLHVVPWPLAVDPKLNKKSMVKKANNRRIANLSVYEFGLA
jgi:hypothetical protein